MITQIITSMEKFFSLYCNKDGSFNIPDCRSCINNVFHGGCNHKENPMNKIEKYAHKE